MNLPILIAIPVVIFFGILAIYFSLNETRITRRLKEKNKKYQLKLYEATVLKEIQDNINYSLNVEKITDIVTNNLEILLPYSTVASLLLQNGKLVFHAKIKEPVNTSFIAQVKDHMLKSMPVLTNEALTKSIEEKIDGAGLNENNNSSPSSFFNIPLIINEKIQGMINISSTRTHLYKEEEMTTFCKITNIACHTLSILQEIPIKEKGKFTSLITSLKDGVIIIDTNNQITAINKTAKNLLNIQNDNPTITQIFNSLPNSFNFGDKINKAITLNQKIEEKKIWDNNGKIFDITITPILDILGKEPKVTGASFLIHDVTPEKSLSKTKEDFINVIVHELRSPLTSIKASTEMLTEQNNLTEEDKKTLMIIINNQTSKMLEEVATILDASKLETGLFTVQKTKANIKNIIEDTIESFRITAQKKSINLISHIDPLLPEAKFDTYNIHRCLNNLLSNSFKFTPQEGTITVRAWLTPQSSAQQDETGLSPEKISVSVSDTGSGIPIDKQHLLFSKFTQINDTNGVKGTGLGLYLVKGIIEAHGGTISLESEPNKGTIITFNIPVDSPANSSPTITSPIPEKPLNPLVN